MWQRWGWIGLCYIGLASWLTWPALLSPAEVVPGAERTDLWNSLWSFWWATQNLGDGVASIHTHWLDHPTGGHLMVADPLGVPVMWLLRMWMPLSAAYTVLVISRLALAGLLAHGLAEEWMSENGHEIPRWGGAAWIAGVGYATAPILISSVHNGASESIAGGWVVLAVWMCWRATRLGGWKRISFAVLSLVGAALASWYGALIAFVFAGSLTLIGTGAGIRVHVRRRALILLVGLGLVAPIAMSIKDMSQGYMVTDAGDTSLDEGENLTEEEFRESVEAFGADSFEVAKNLVLIKDSRELNLVRRTTGAADPIALVRGGDFRSPDFRKISRYGENFFHCSYLGWVLVVVSLVSLRRRRSGTGFIWLGGILCLLLALGPVLVRDGSAVVLTLTDSEGLADHRAFPLPYFLVEQLPGFDSLSLLYRLVQGPALALSLLAAIAMAGRRPRWIVLTLVAMLLEARFVAPTQADTGTSDAALSPRLLALAEAPDGAVMNFPVVGGRAYLYEQTLHQKPIAGTLNFPNNRAARKVWQAMIDNLILEETGEFDPDAFRVAVRKSAKNNGVRYVVVHVDAEARPDMHDEAVRSLRQTFEPLEEAPVTQSANSLEWSVEVFKLW